MAKFSSYAAIALAAAIGTTTLPIRDPADLSMAPTGTVKQITLTNLRTSLFAGGTGFTAGDPLTVGAITPDTDNTRSLGTAAKRWSDVRANTATFSGQVTASDGAVGAPAIRLASVQSGWYYVGGGVLGLSVGGTNTVSMTAPAWTFNTTAISGVSTLAGTGAISGFTTLALSGNITMTGTNAIEIDCITTTTGAGGIATFLLRRGDTNGYARVYYQSGATNNWTVGMRSGDSKYGIWDEINGLAAISCTAGAAPSVAFSGPVSGFTTSVQTGTHTITSAATSVAGSGTDIVLGATTQTTIGANGAASALTANPLGYLVFFKGATKCVLPYYNG